MRFPVQVKLLTILFVLFANILNAQLVGMRDDMKKGILSNGLTYFIHQNNTPASKVELRLVVNAGSMQESESQRGLAHFTEHMLFNGTRNYPKNSLVEYLESIGVRFGHDLNAYTSFDETVYFLPIPTNDKKNVEEGFKILREWASEALFTEQDIDEERGVIIEEKRSGNNANSRFIDKILPKYLNLDYAQRLPIGLDSVILYAPYEELRNFYKDWYRPDLMAIIVVGDITIPEAEQLIVQYFTDFKNPKVVIPKEEIIVNRYDKNSGMVLSDPEAESYEIEIAFSRHKAPNYASIHAYRNTIIEQIIFTVLNNRLKEIQELPMPPYVSASISWEEMMRGYRGVLLNIRPHKDINLGIKTVVEELNRLITHGITAEELNWVKSIMEVNIQYELDNYPTIESSFLVQEYQDHFLKGKTIEGPQLKKEYYDKMLPTITLKEVVAYAQKLLDRDETFFVSITGPDTRKVKMPTDREAVKLITDAMKSTMSAYEPQKQILALMDTKDIIAKKGRIVKEWKDATIGVSYLQLENGIKVAYKQTQFRSNEVVVNAAAYGGWSNYHTANNLQRENAYFFNHYINDFPFGGHNKIALRNYLASKKANVTFALEEFSNTLEGKSSVRDLEVLFQMIYLKFVDINMDDKTFAHIVNTVKPTLEHITSDPMNNLINEINKVMYGESKLAPIIIPETDYLDNVRLDALKEIYVNEIFNNASNYTFSFVGNINVDKFKEYVSFYLGALPKSNKGAKYVDNGLRKIKGYNEVKVSGFAAVDKAMIFKMIYGDVMYDEMKAVKANIFTTILNNRIQEEIREKMGAMYSGATFVELNKLPSSSFQINFILPCAVGKVQAVMNATNTIINQFRVNGITTKELNSVKSQLLESYKEDVASNYIWASNIIEYNLWQKNPALFIDYKKIINSLSLKDINDTIAEILGSSTNNVLDALLLPKE